MLEMIMFGVVLTISLTVSSLLVLAVSMKLCTSKKFIMKYYNLIMELTNDMIQQMNDNEDLEN